MKDELTLNGHPVIHHHTAGNPLHNSIFLHDNMLVFVLRGSYNISYGAVTITVDGSKLAFLRKDRLFLVNTGSAGQDTVEPECLLISLRPDLVKEFVKVADLRTTVVGAVETVKTADVDFRLRECVNTILSLLKGNEKVSDSLVRIKLLEILFYISAGDRTILEQILDLREHYRTNITAVVEENILNSISLNQLARLAGRSLSSFRRDFLAVYNTSPSKWIREKRLEKARELLQSTTMTITDICYTLGFENIAHFSRLFKSYFQHSPSAYRMTISMTQQKERA